MSNYSELLKDPRWQKKRLEILQRDEWTCKYCKSDTKILHVHHVKYINGACPWDYPDKYLLTLCEDCHEEEESLKVALRNKVFPGLLNDCEFSMRWLYTIIEGIRYIEISDSPYKVAHAISSVLSDPNNIKRIIEWDKESWDSIIKDQEA